MSFKATSHRMLAASAAVAFSLLTTLWAPVAASGEEGQPALADEPRLSVAEFGQLFNHLHVKNQPWASIPWQTSLTAARNKAARENKPIFFNVNTGNALGFT